MEANAIAELAREGFEKRLGTYGYIKTDNCYIPYADGFEDGYKKGLEAKINTTTISDCPLPDGDREAYIKKLLQSDIDKHNKIAALSRKVYDLQKQSDQLTKAKEIIEELSKSLFLAKGIVRDLIDDTVDFKESKERALYCYEQEKFDAYKKAEKFLNGVEK